MKTICLWSLHIFVIGNAFQRGCFYEPQMLIFLLQLPILLHGFLNTCSFLFTEMHQIHSNWLQKYSAKMQLAYVNISFLSEFSFPSHFKVVLNSSFSCMTKAAWRTWYHKRSHKVIWFAKNSSFLQMNADFLESYCTFSHTAYWFWPYRKTVQSHKRVEALTCTV